MDDEELKEQLANLIVKNIQKEFSTIHFSGNLMNTLKVYKTEKGWAVDIPAEIFDIDMYKKKGVIIYTGTGSYAESVDESGGFSKKHKNYVQRAINKSIEEWKAINKFKIKTKKYGD